ncbi:type I secretion membrane protein, ATP binding protein, protein export [Enterobacter cancerogenus]|uniref:Type I secretion membrane protein, ATP binding protein, protein export n=1 Tax=Enterobacter cancerogenus TaxID=69218 RepID=A0A484YY23_9ENTR|nr:type I secretion membrane protein, ATP binding protein, protein export [Enterobacter cancerogenus]
MQSIVYAVVLLVGCYLVIAGDMTTGALVGDLYSGLAHHCAVITDLGRAVTLAVGKSGAQGAGMN